MNVDPGLVRRLDELVRTDLKDLRDSYFARLLYFSGVVAVGVLLEGPEVLHEVWDKLRQHLSFSEHRVPSWVLYLSLIGWLCVSIGIVGEGIFEGFVSVADGLLQTFNDTLLADAQRQTAVALSNAESARATAKEFESQIADSSARAKTAEAQVATAMAASADAVSKVAAADARSAEASAKAESFRLDIAKANESAAKAGAQAAEAQLALETFKAPRTPSAEQQRQMRAILSPFPGTPYELAVDPIPEAISLVTVVDAVLRSSGWINKESAKKDFRFNFTLPSGSQVEQAYLSGVIIAFTKATVGKFESAVNALRPAFKIANIDVTGQLLKDDDASPDNIHIMIGAKP